MAISDIDYCFMIVHVALLPLRVKQGYKLNSDSLVALLAIKLQGFEFVADRYQQLFLFLSWSTMLG